MKDYYVGEVPVQSASGQQAGSREDRDTFFLIKKNSIQYLT